MPDPIQVPVVPPKSVLDMRGIGMFPPGGLGSDPQLSELCAPPNPLGSIDTQSGRVGDDGMVEMTVRLTSEEFQLLSATAALRKRLGDGLAPEVRAFVERFDRAIAQGTVTELTADNRGDPYSCLDAYVSDMAPREREAVTVAAGNLPPMEPQCRATICIPVAAHEEQRHIYRTLKAFSRQDVSPDTFEIVLFLNHPSAKKDGSAIGPDRTINEVVRFSQDFPDLRVRSFYSVLHPDDAKIGLIRKFLNDVVVMRHYWRGREAPEHCLIRTDADTHGVKPGYIANYLKLFDRHPNVDAFKGKLDWDWPSYLKDPALLFGTRLFMALDSFIHSTTDNIGGGGANFAIRTSRYADIGGYDPGSEMAEDVGLGVALNNMRSGAIEHIAIRCAGAASILYTDNRRGWAALRKGHAPVCQWHNGDTDFGAENSEIRAVPFAVEGQTFAELLLAPEFSERVQSLIQQTFDFYAIPSDPVRLAYIERVLPMLGVKAVQGEDGKIVVSDISVLIDRMRNFHDFAPSYWRDTLGFEM